MRRAAGWIAVAVGAGAIAVTAAAQRLERGAPVLHRDLRSPLARPDAARPAPGSPPAADPAPSAASSVIGAPPTAGRNPTAIGIGDKVLPEPPPEPVGGDEPIFGGGGFAADRQTEIAPDSATGGDDALTYVEVFNPSIVPFKRLSALSAVRDDYHLINPPGALTELPVGAPPTAGFHRFWGSLVVALRPGEDVAIPSVAPGMRVLSYEVTPRTQLTFSVDAADNFYVRTDEPAGGGTRRLVFLVEADPGYFAASVPRGVRVAEVARARGAPAIAPVPPNVLAVARSAHRLLRVSAQDDLGVALRRLVAHFRGFVPGHIDRPSDNTYFDLVRNQIGVCRHRAFGFAITANALGIPTRFVANEAHAFVEVWLPRAGWTRIDLGGASRSFDVRNAEGKAMYQPRGADPFPRPEPYRTGGAPELSNYSELQGNLSGLTPAQLAERRDDRADAAGEATSSGGATGDGSAGDGAAGDGAGADDAGDGEARPSLGPGDGLPPIPAWALRGKEPVKVAVDSASAIGFRGEAIQVDGRIVDGGDAGVVDLRVDLYLAPAGQDGNGARLVGHTMTSADGRFTAQVTVPVDLALADHEVFAATPGDRTHQPALSR